MTRTIPVSTALAMGACVMWILAFPGWAEAQRAVRRGGGQTATSGRPSGPASGGSAARPPADGGGQRSPRAAPAGRSAPRSSPPATVREPSDGPTGTPTDAAGPIAPQDRDGGSVRGREAPPHTRPRGDNPQVGEAVARRGVAPPRDGTIIVPGGYRGGYYPWGYGGLGIGGYYDPWGYGGYGYPQYGGQYDGRQYPGQYDGRRYDGAIRLKVKPRDATVYVDGYYVGRVNDFDGVFQRLRLEPGPHRIEARADGYETLSFEVRILPDRTITYEGELQRLADREPGTF